MDGKTSIIVVTYNALDYVRGCLESLLKYTDERHEIVVVDNDSKEDLKEYLRDFQTRRKNIVVQFNPENVLWSPGNNIGIKHSAADSEFVLLLNSDTEILQPDWLERLQEPFRTYENVAVTGIQHNFLPIAPMYGAIDGCCFMTPKKLIEEVGLLDENYPWNGAGFVFSSHVWAKGYHYYHVNEDIVIHFGKRSRVDNSVMMNNTKVDVFDIMKKDGLQPKKDMISMVSHSLGTFDANKKMKKWLKPRK